MTATAIAAAGALALPSLASAADFPVTFTATDNGDCTATFDITNTTSSDMNDVVYWTGDDRPTEAPPFGEDAGSNLAVTSVVEAGQPTWNNNSVYAKGYEPTTSSATVDFTDASVDGADVEVAYRMTGLEQDDYDTSLKSVTVTGCDAPFGSLGELFNFGS
ncbi:MAG: hypothetical protein GX610_18620 [Rhodococcus sp.]|nr:hypothetical protein [Rhodococcus sp. (in: high G+C Gram-positive bacteria)]